METEAIIRTVDLGKTVSTSEGELSILKGIDIEIKKSESVAIVGASGSGKTTLLSLVAGLDVPTRGEIHLGKYAITDMDEEQRANVHTNAARRNRNGVLCARRAGAPLPGLRTSPGSDQEQNCKRNSATN